MKRIIERFVIALICLFFTQAAISKTLYIHDTLRVDMRSGPTLGYRIIDFLSSGTQLELLKTQDDWIKVRADGKEGWIQEQYTTDQPIARDKLKQAAQEIQSLRTENAELKKQLNSTESNYSELKSEHRQVSASTEKIQKELDRIQKISRDAIATETAYRALQEEAELLKVEIEKLKLENVRLDEDNFSDGIRWGAAAVLLGVLLAWMISKSSARKRRSEW